MTQLQQAVDDLIGGLGRAAGSQEPRTDVPAGVLAQAAAGAVPQATQRAPSGQQAAPGVPSAVYDRSGAAYPVRYRVVEGDTLHPASAEFQPRDRTRASSDVQIQQIAANLAPERLGASAELGAGAPLVTPQGMVIDGNGRYAGIMRAHANAGPSAQRYRQTIAQQFPEAATMRAPVLVKELDGVTDPAALVRIAREANSPAGMAFSATERAATDAGRLTPDLLGLYRGGEIGDASNRDFVRGFLRSVPQAEHNALVTPDGRLSVEGGQRIRQALGHAAYQDSGLITAIAEANDDSIRAFGSSLLDTAPEWAKLRGGIQSGTIRTEMDITPSILEAARIVQQARGRGVPLADALAQRDAFAAADPIAERVLQLGYGANLTGRVSRAKLADALRFYADEAGKQTTEARLFADMPATQPAEILNVAGNRYGQAAEAAGQSVGAGSARTSGGAGRAEARGSFDGAAGAADAGRSTGRGNDRILPEGPLTANFDAEAAGRYRSANAAYRDYADTYRNGPVGGALRTDKGYGYRVSDSEVAGSFFNAGRHAKEDVAAFVKAAGSREGAAGLLLDYAASSLRGFAVGPDGAINPTRWRAWMDRHYQALKALDSLTGTADLRTRFQNVADAQALVDSMGEAKAQAVGEFQQSAARFFLGDADPVKAVESALRSKNPTAAFADLARRVAPDQEATAGLRRAVIEHMQARLRGNAEAGDTGLTVWKSDAFQTYVRQNEQALRQVFTADQIDAMKAIAADLQRANRSVAGSKLPGGSDTVQNAAALAHLPGASALWRVLSGAGLAGSGAYGGLVAGGPIGAAVGGAAGALIQLGRELGMRKINDLLTEAMLNPALAAQLLAKVPQTQEASFASLLLRRLQQVGLIAATSDAAGSKLPPRQPVQKSTTGALMGGSVPPITAPPLAPSQGGGYRNPLAQALAGH